MSEVNSEHARLKHDMHIKYLETIKKFLPHIEKYESEGKSIIPEHMDSLEKLAAYKNDIMETLAELYRVEKATQDLCVQLTILTNEVIPQIEEHLVNKNIKKSSQLQFTSPHSDLLVGEILRGSSALEDTRGAAK